MNFKAHYHLKDIIAGEFGSAHTGSMCHHMSSEIIELYSSRYWVIITNAGNIIYSSGVAYTVRYGIHATALRLQIKAVCFTER